MTFVVKSSAPGKVILHGEHAVVFGKQAIAMSVGLRTQVQVIRNPQADLLQISYDGLVSDTVWTLRELQTIQFGDHFLFPQLTLLFEGVDIKTNLVFFSQNYCKMKRKCSISRKNAPLVWINWWPSTIHVWTPKQETPLRRHSICTLVCLRWPSMRPFPDSFLYLW